MSLEQCVKIVERSSREYEQALDLRYDKIYGQLNIPRHLITDELEDKCDHYVCVLDNVVVAYARMMVFSDGVAEYSEIVMDKTEIGQEACKRLIGKMTQICQERAVKIIQLFAPKVDIEFYQKIGFVSSELEFMSKRTKMLYIPMRKELAV